MNSPIELAGAQHRYATGAEPDRRGEKPRPKFDPETGERIIYGDEPQDPPKHGKADHERIEEQFVQDTPVNPYAPTGWKRKERIEFDLSLPSGQLCRVLRLEREDLFRLNLMQYLDTFTPMLMDSESMSNEQRDKKLQDAMKEKPEALANMFMAIDEVVMAATLIPRITTDENLVDYGTPEDWRNPKFISTALLSDIKMEDKMAIFASAFGRSMDDLKSLWAETPGVGSVADESVVQQIAE